VTCLPEWIAQQVAQVEEVARDATEGPWCADHPEPRHWGDDPEAALVVQGKVLCILDNQYNGHLNADHMVMHDPAAVLRRCEADRRILARHRLATEWEWAFEAPCHGCGTQGDCDDPVTDNLNECPELLDLGYAHGLTDEILASFDRPQTPPRPKVKPLGGVLPPGIGATADVSPALRGPHWKGTTA
jgi:hypothetical protein